MTNQKKPTLQDLVRIPKHANFYVNPINGRITYRQSADGKSVTIRTGKTKIGEAKAFVELELQARREGKTLRRITREKQGNQNPAFIDIYDECIEAQSVGKSNATKRSYRVSRNIFEEFFAGKNLHDLSSPHIFLEMKVWYLKEHGTRMFHKTLIHLNMSLDYCVKSAYLPKKPDTSVLDDLNDIIKQNTQYEKGGKVYTERESEALIGAWEKLEFGTGGLPEGHSIEIIRARARSLVALAREGGGRKMEICSMRKERVEFEKNRYWLYSTKNRKWREVPMTKRVRAALREQFKVNDHFKSEWVFPMPTDPKRHIYGQIADKVWNRCKEVAGINGEAWFHDLRRTFATQTGEEGWAPQVACEILDMSLQTYMRVYCKPGSASKQAIMKKSFEDKT